MLSTSSALNPPPQHHPKPHASAAQIGGDRDLLQDLGRMRKAPLGKRVVHLLASTLSGRKDFAKDLAMANDAISAVLVTGASHKLYNLSNGDIVFCYSQISSPVIVALCTSLETTIFAGAVPQKNLYGEYGHYKLFDVARDINRIIEGIRLALAAEPVVGAAKPPIQSKHAEYICEKLRGSNIRSIVFNQPIYNITHAKPSIEFLEFYTSIEQLEKLFVPDRSIPGNPWLFNLIKRELDVSVMRAINSEIADYRHKAFSLNLLVDSFMSDGFRTFVGSLPVKLGGRVLVELDKADLVQHSHCMDDLFLRARELGVPVCVDGLSHHDIQMMRLTNIPASFFKLKWDAEIGRSSAEQMAIMVREITSAKGRVILTRCDSPKSLSFARAMGVTYIQGRLVDEFFRTGTKLD